LNRSTRRRARWPRRTAILQAENQLDGRGKEEKREGGKRVRGRPKKLRGCIAASPTVPNFCKEAYRFFLAFFFAAILFSSRIFRCSRQQSWRSAYTVTMYKDCALSCQEESDRAAQKNQNPEIVSRLQSGLFSDRVATIETGRPRRPLPSRSAIRHVA
jgi:hypothetical protein